MGCGTRRLTTNCCTDKLLSRPARVLFLSRDRSALTVFLSFGLCQVAFDADAYLAPTLAKTWYKVALEFVDARLEPLAGHAPPRETSPHCIPPPGETSSP